MQIVPDRVWRHICAAGPDRHAGTLPVHTVTADNGREFAEGARQIFGSGCGGPPGLPWCEPFPPASFLQQFPSTNSALVQVWKTDSGQTKKSGVHPFADHARVSAALGAGFFFARPYHSWERGPTGHTNGLVRGYLPMGTDLRRVTDAEVSAVQNRTDARPRKVLGYLTPTRRSCGRGLPEGNPGRTTLHAPRSGAGGIL